MEIILALSLPFKGTGNVKKFMRYILRPGNCFAPDSRQDFEVVNRLTNRMVPSTSILYIKKQTYIEYPLPTGS